MGNPKVTSLVMGDLKCHLDEGVWAALACLGKVFAVPFVAVYHQVNVLSSPS
jgi:hypothetical protein